MFNLYHMLIGELDTSTIIAGDFNTPLISMDRISRQKINKETLALKDIFYHMNLVVFYRTFHPKAEEYTGINAVIIKVLIYSTGYSTCWDTKEISINRRRLKLHQASFLTTVVWGKKSTTRRNWKKHKHGKLKDMLPNYQ